MNYPILASSFGVLFVGNALLLIIPLPWVFFDPAITIVPFLIPCLIAAFLGVGLLLYAGGIHPIKLREGFLLSAMGGICFTFFSALPFTLQGTLSFSQSFFEAMSGWTTTGVSLIPQLEQIPQALLFWRALLQWIGGLSIVIVSLFVPPILEIAGVQILRSENTVYQSRRGPHLSSKFWKNIYWFMGLFVGMTVLCFFMLWFFGMSWFEALCHAFSTIATGGFSTRSSGIVAFESASIEWILVLFMIFGGTNFVLLGYVLQGNWATIRINTEFFVYLSIIVGGSLGTFLIIYWSGVHVEMATSIRKSMFHVVSFLTTTGYVSSDYTIWPNSAQMFLFLLLFTGACAGSTTSGIRLVQGIVLWKYFYSMGKRLLQPLAILPIRINRQPINDQTIQTVLGLFILHFLYLFLASCLLTMITPLEFVSAFNAVIAALWNTASSFGEETLSSSFNLSETGIWLLSFTMMAGRMGIIVLLILCYPSYWKKH